MAKNKDPYNRLKQRFVEQRAEDRGYSELSLEQKEKFSRRFDVLAQTVEGRGKIATQILGTEAPQERRRALRQRLRQNLPQKPSDTKSEDKTGPTAPVYSDGRPIVSPAGRVGSPSLRGAMAPKPAAPKAEKKKDDGRIGSGFWSIPSSPMGVIKEFGQELKGQAEYYSRVYVNPALNVGISALNAITPGEGNKIKKFAEPTKKEILTESAFTVAGGFAGPLARVVGNVAGRVAGSIGAELIERGAVATGSQLVGMSQRRFALNQVRQQMAREQLGTKLMGGAELLEGVKPGQKPAPSTRKRPTAPGAKVAEVKAATNKTKPVISTVADVAPTPPAQKTPTVSPKPAAKPKSKKKSKPATANVKPNVSEPKIVFEQPAAPPPPPPPPSLPKPEIATIPGFEDLGPVKFAEPATPPTEMQKTLTPEQLTAPVAEVKPATTAEVVKPAKGKKGGKSTKAKSEAKVTFEDTTNVEPAKGTPASKEVVGGAAPKAQVEPTSPSITQPSPQKNLPVSTASKKTSATPVVTLDQPSPAGKEPKPGKGLLKQPKVVSYEEFTDPVTGKKVRRTVYESQAKEMAERTEKLKAQGVPKGTMTFDDGRVLKTTSSGSNKPKIIFEEQTTKQGEKLMVPANEAAQKAQDEFLILRADPNKPQETFANIEWQMKQKAEVEEIAARRGQTAARRSRSRMAKEAQPNPKKITTWSQETKEALETAMTEERRRMPIERRNIKTRRTGRGEIPGRRTKKAPKTIEEATERAKLFDVETKEGRIRTVTGTKEEAAAADPRTVAEIRRDTEILMNRFEEEQAKRAKAKPRKSKPRNINLRPSAEIQAEAAERIRQSMEMQRLQRMAELAPDVQTTSGRSSRARRTYRKEMRAVVKKGKVQPDVTPGLRQTVNFEDADLIAGSEMTPVDITYREGMAEFTGERVRQAYSVGPDYIEARPLLGPEAPAGVERVTYAEKFSGPQLSYEELLRIEKSGEYEFVQSKTPFSRRTHGGYFQRKEGRRGLSSAGIKGNTQISPDEIRRLIDATTTKASKK